MTFRKAVLSLAVLLLVTVPLALAQGTYTQIDVPGAMLTQAYGIDTDGDVCGTYVDASGVEHGFLSSGGAYTVIDYPGASGTEVFGMNDLGQFVGYASVQGSSGFSYDSRTQTFTVIGYPGSLKTLPTAINDTGTIAGYFDSDLGQFGFELAGSSYKHIAPTGASNSTVLGISASGALSGYVNSHAGSYANFVFSRGDFQRITIANAPGATVAGINPAGTALVGIYQLSSGVYAGFSYQNRKLKTIQFPGSNATVAYSINADGIVVGYFIDSSSTYHGFTWTPPADSAKK
jgi:probable HAF family extracellular repeat protein